MTQWHAICDDFSPHEPILLVKAHTTVTVNRCKHAIFPNLTHLVNFFGLGASSRLQEPVFLSKAAVEWSSPLADLHRRIQASVNRWTKGTFVRCKLWSKWKKHIRGPQPFCHVNPFGNRGLQGGKDIRASTAPAVGQAFCLLQVPRLILECVPPACTTEFVCQTMDMQLCEFTLKLEDTWAANRFWWWIVGMSKLRVFKLRRTPWMITWLYRLYQPNSRELSAFRVCKLVQPAEFRLTCNGFMASLSGFVAWFSADFGMLGRNGPNGRCGRFSHQRSIHRKWSTFKWLQRRAVVRLNICKSVFPVLHYHGTGACELRFVYLLHLCFQPVWPWQLTWGKQGKPIRKDQTECLAPGLKQTCPVESGKRCFAHAPVQPRGGSSGPAANLKCPDLSWGQCVLEAEWRLTELPMSWRVTHSHGQWCWWNRERMTNGQRMTKSEKNSRIALIAPKTRPLGQWIAIPQKCFVCSRAIGHLPSKKQKLKT